jgi:hypothetical protein
VAAADEYRPWPNRCGSTVAAADDDYEYRRYATEHEHEHERVNARTALSNPPTQQTPPSSGGSGASPGELPGRAG